jgi:hypothetical protein
MFKVEDQEVQAAIDQLTKMSRVYSSLDLFLSSRTSYIIVDLRVSLDREFSFCNCLRTDPDIDPLENEKNKGRSAAMNLKWPLKSPAISNKQTFTFTIKASLSSEQAPPFPITD